MNDSPPIDVHDMCDCPIECQERAAIMEYCGALTRDEANAKARELHGIPPRVFSRSKSCPVCTI